VQITDAQETWYEKTGNGFWHRFRFRFNRIVQQTEKIEYNRQQVNATMRYKHTVDYEVAQNSEWQQGWLC